jgi:hypothetical protein
MTTYRKKPVVVQAEQFIKDSPNIPRGVIHDEFNRPYVITIHGQSALLADKDWVIEEPDGEHYYPCKPDIFARTYESVES